MSLLNAYSSLVFISHYITTIKSLPITYYENHTLNTLDLILSLCWAFREIIGLKSKVTVNSLNGSSCLLES
jgi:hypothetical protein